MSKFQILAMDGGFGFNTADLLLRIQATIGNSGDNFLSQVDLFSGVSAGGINSLFFASHDDPTAALSKIMDFWKEVNKSMLEGLSPDRIQQALQAPSAVAWNIWHVLQHLGLAAIGWQSLLTSDKMRQLFLSYFGPDLRLSDLKHKVAILTFQLDNEDPDPSRRRWKPVLYNNFPVQAADEILKTDLRELVAAQPLMDELVVDVALRTSAAPIELPIYQGIDGSGSGYIDGGVVANNPAVTALALAFQKNVPLEDILMLSIGTGRNLTGSQTRYVSPPFVNGTASWGYGQWLFDLKSPLLLLNLVLQSTTEIVTYQAHQLLDTRFFRINPYLTHMTVPNNPEVQERVNEAVEWMRLSGWLSEPAPAAAPEAAPKGEVFLAAQPEDRLRQLVFPPRKPTAAPGNVPIVVEPDTPIPVSPPVAGLESVIALTIDPNPELDNPPAESFESPLSEQPEEFLDVTPPIPTEGTGESTGGEAPPASTDQPESSQRSDTPPAPRRRGQRS